MNYRMLSNSCPNFIKNIYSNIYYKNIVRKEKKRFPIIINKIKNNNHANVLFILSDLSMWRYEYLFQLLKLDKRFTPNIAILPFSNIIGDAKEKKINQIKNYVIQKNFSFSIIKDDNDFLLMKNKFEPDIIIYQQPYSINSKIMNWIGNTDCLQVYFPYFIGISSGKWVSNYPFHQMQWRHYLPTELHKNDADKVARKKHKNIRIIGDLRREEFTIKQEHDPWKKINDGFKRKRIIWAPHFQLTNNSIFNRNDFIWAYKTFEEIISKYEDKIQIAFKPHPSLRPKLYEMPGWGKERTDKFYNLWAISKNTQLEEGEYVELFKTSDALIHNCGSFSAEYLYTEKPVAYLTKDINKVIEPLREFGTKCIKSHYILSSSEEIYDFIEKVVLGNFDSLREKRKEVKKILTKSYGDPSPSRNIYNDWVNSLFNIKNELRN